VEELTSPHEYCRLGRIAVIVVKARQHRRRGREQRGKGKRREEREERTAKEEVPAQGKSESTNASPGLKDSKDNANKINNTIYAKPFFFVATGFFVIWARVSNLEYRMP
jgi:hypothetical protein